MFYYLAQVLMTTGADTVLYNVGAVENYSDLQYLWSLIQSCFVG